MSIIKITGINQYAIIDDYGTVYEPDDIFYTPESGEREGREAINTVSN